MTRRTRSLLVVVLSALLLAVGSGAGTSAVPPGPGSSTDPVGVWPLLPRPDVERFFDPPASTWGAGHRGVDLRGHVGQPVRSALPGRVVFTGSIAGRPVVTVSHGSTRTTYEPVASQLPRGTRVGAGQVIGTLGVAGSHCFPAACLHWGWIRGETYLDPLRLVGGGPVRLLPLAGLGAGAPAVGARGGSAELRMGASGAASTGALPRTSPYAGWRPAVGGPRLWP